MAVRGRHNKTKPIRVGVLGVWRGMTFANGAKHAGMELVALCDTWKDRLRTAGKNLGVETYTDYEKFLEHDMDAVILANYFHQHAPFAIKALESGRHVMSETTACKTPAEGVALIRAVEKSKKIYMLAENYAYFCYNQEMRRLYREGEIGELMYGEGEYIHPIDSRTYNWLAPGMNHWRNHIPGTYYCTHALAPLMAITELMPVSVNGLCIPLMDSDKERDHVRHGDPGSVILCRMENGSVVRLAGLLLRGHGNWYRLHGTRGLMENQRTGNRGLLRIVHDPWDRKEGDVSEKLYEPEWPEHGDLARQAGHGGGDFFTSYHFAEAIRQKKQPFFDVHRGVAMSMVGIQSYRSALENGTPFEIPDFHKEALRRKYQDDIWSPFPEDRAPGQPFPSIKGDLKPGRKAVASARKVWKEMGYEGE